MKKKYSLLQRLLYVRPQESLDQSENAELPSLFPFDDEEVEKLNKVWDDAWIASARHEADGVHLITHDGGFIHIQRKKISLSAAADDAALRSLVLHAKENWGGKLAPSPDNTNIEQIARVWAHCQVHGVKFAWQPPAHMAERMKRMVEGINHHEYLIEQGETGPAYGSHGNTYRFPLVDPVRVPNAGSPPNIGLKVNGVPLLTDIGPQPALARMDIDLDRVNEGYRSEREEFLRARNAGLITTAQIADFGLRVRMTACDREDARRQHAQTQRPLPRMAP